MLDVAESKAIATSMFVNSGISTSFIVTEFA